MVISVEKATKQFRKIPDWKPPEKDGVEGYWIKNLSNLHERTAVQTNKILMGNENPLAWMAHGCTVLCQKHPRKGNVVENSCPMTCLSLMWKLLAGVIPEEIMIILSTRNSCQKNKRDGDQ